ncbi:MAG: GNAT family N-acetyltransferase [Fimbriimonadaceae bacterium]|nr:GNAT family N-acetyltransferase [Fimbriimonadaceae bacterium]
MSSVSLREITELTDPRLPDFLDAIATGFPADEQMPPGYYLRLLARRAAGDPAAAAMHLATAHDDAARWVGLTMWEESEPLSCLWYLWVAPSERNRGIGAAIYQAVVARCQASRGLIIEVERPDFLAPNSPACAFAKRRIGFYQRQGAVLLPDLVYRQSCGRDDQPARLMYLMVHPFQPLTPADLEQAARDHMGEDVLS